jgi:DNA-binding NtrC family response regulator
MQTKARLLFVDDEERIVNLLRMIFRADYEVHTATSGRQALEIIAAHRIDVLVSDQRMPEMVGIELLSEVRKRSPATMRILLTGYSDLAAIVGSVNDGEVFRFINKPWDHAEIKGIIADAVAAARASVEVSAQPVDLLLTEAGAGERPELLLLDDNQGDRQAMAKVIGADYTVHGAASIPEALKVLEERDIGVIVSEARIGGSDAGELLRVLKQHYPSITTVMLTNSADADLVIKLINGAQIFRFATKPIRAGVFQLAVSAAMKEHQRFRANPALVNRHRVAASSEPENKALVASVMHSLGNWRSRFTRIARLMR